MTRTLDEWLQYLEQCHPSNIELGLDRVSAVAARLDISLSNSRIITVGGTNGKGSTVTMLCAILEAAGYSTCSYTSPHLLTYNERVRLGERLATDEELCDSFAAVEGARDDTPLTYFEFGTLAAFQLFAKKQPDFAVLEIGLGGRLDAVNIIDPDIAIVTNIALDHVDWLGDTREAIGKEKAGIFRKGVPAIVGERETPHSLTDHATTIGSNLYQNGVAFSAVSKTCGSWTWQGKDVQGNEITFESLPGNDFPLDNCAAVLQAVMLAVPGIGRKALEAGLVSAVLPGRFQLVERGYPLILDVAHNPHAARRLVQQMQASFQGHRILLVFAMLADKNYREVLEIFSDLDPFWYVAGIHEERGLEAKILYNCLSESDVGKASEFNTIREAYLAAEKEAESLKESGKPLALLVTGSFFTVTAVMELL